MAYGAYLGSYALGDDLTEFEINSESRVNQVAIPRRDGLLSDPAYEGGLSIRLAGEIIEVTDVLARAKANSIRNAMSGGKFIFTLYDDRQIEVQKQFFAMRYINGNLRNISWEAQLVADDFGFVAVNPTEQEETINASPETNTFTNNGNLEAPLVIRITAGSSNIASGLRIDNLSTGEFLTYNAQIDAGDYVEIDTDLLTAVDQGDTNVLANVQGDFFGLAAGANSIKWTGTATGSPKLKLTYRDKYSGA